RRAADIDAVTDELLSYADRIRPMVADTSLVLNQALDAGKTLVFEAGQATMLDVDHGTYPFVTSSSATAGGAATGSGIGPTRLDRIVGVIKATPPGWGRARSPPSSSTTTVRRCARPVASSV